MIEKQPMIVFDFDGVIADTFAALYHLNATLDPLLSKSEYRSWFEGNVYDAVSKPAHRGVPAEEFFVHYEQLITDQKIFSGMENVVSALAREFHLAIISSSKESVVEDFLRAHDLHRAFKMILGYETDRSKIKKFQLLFERAQVAPAECLMITDTLGDIREAVHVGVPAIAVDWGFHERATLERGTAKHIVSSADELLHRVREHFYTVHT